MSPGGVSGLVEWEDVGSLDDDSCSDISRSRGGSEVGSDCSGVCMEDCGVDVGICCEVGVGDVQGGVRDRYGRR